MHIRIAIADDQTLVREGLKSVIQSEGDMEMTHEFDTLEDARKFLEESPNIHLIIVDICLHDNTGIALIELATQKNIKCLVVSMHGTEPHISQAMHAGACGYISKAASASELVDGIRAVANDKTHYCREIKDYLLANDAKRNPFAVLTGREMGICRQILDGVKIKRIATALDISPKTVYVHKANAYKKLGIDSTQELFKLARENGVQGF